jgi:hypothetical protein
MARTKESHLSGLVLSSRARAGFVLFAGLAALLMLSAAACGGGAGSEPADTRDGSVEASPAGSGADSGSGDATATASPGAPITITTYRPPT